MKNILMLSLGFFLIITVIGQVNTGQVPFIIRGQLRNYTEKQVFLFFKEGRVRVIDTISVLADGSFYLKTFKVKRPVRANLFSSKEILSGLYIAPGYHLTISGDVTHFLETRKITGIGETGNQYLFGKDAFLARKENYQPSELYESTLLSFIKGNQHGMDSLYQQYFEKKTANDKWVGYFKKMARLDNKFLKLNYLLNYAIDDTTFNYEKSVRFVRENFDNAILADLYKEEYLISEQYESTLYYYPFYLRTLGCRRKAGACEGNKVNVQLVKEIADNYKGRIKELYLFSKMNSSITFCRSFAELNIYKADFHVYMSNLKDKADRDSLDRLMVKMENTLLKTQVGIAAPIFTAEDSTGKSYTVTDFKGKVVYLDLWASWCGPCRMETPYLEKVADKYRNDSRIVIVSIAVLDKMDKWKAAMNKDKPTWLQLFDTNGHVQQAYVASSIPKFILIDKKGNIVNFDSPFPRTGMELESLLELEMAK